MNALAVLRTAAIVASLIALAGCSAATGSPDVAGNGGPGSPEPSAVAPRGQDQVSTEDPILVDPIPGGNGDVTVPQPGQLDVHPVRAESLEAEVDGQTVTIRISWTSGVEPCYVLDTIVVDKGERSFAVTLFEGHAPGDNVCIEIAKSKVALVDLGTLEPGTYAITDAAGGAAPIEVVVG